MDATAATRRFAWPGASSGVVWQIVRAGLATFFALVALAILLIVARRAGGALAQPLPGVLLVALGLLLALWAAWFRLAASPALDRLHAAARIVAWAVPSLVLVLAALGLILPGTSTAAIVTFLSLLVVEEGWSWRSVLRGERAAGQRLPPADDFASQTAAAARHGGDVLVDGASPALDATSAGEPTDRDALQWMVRQRDETGGETIEGYVRAAFVAGQRHATAHLAICPPFVSMPVCYAEPSDGPPAQVKVAQVLPYGVRLEIKLDEPAAEACDVTVDFSIQERATHSSARGG
jgi:hypothetical protein